MLVLLSKNIYFTIATYFIIGAGSSGRVPITTTYINELVPDKSRILVTTLYNVIEGSVLII